MVPKRSLYGRCTCAQHREMRLNALSSTFEYSTEATSLVKPTDSVRNLRLRGGQAVRGAT